MSAQYNFNPDPEELTAKYKGDPRLPLFQAKLESDPAFARAARINDGASVLMSIFQKLGFDGTAEALGIPVEEFKGKIVEAVADLTVALGWALVELAVAGADLGGEKAVDDFLKDLFKSGPDLTA